MDISTGYSPTQTLVSAHFDVLTHFGVWGSGRNSTIFKVSNSPSVGNQTVCVLKGTWPSKDLPHVSTLLHDFRAAVPDDAFLGDVLQAILTQMTISIGTFSSMTTTFFVFVEVKMWCPESVYLQGAVLRAAHGDSLLAGHPGIDRTTASIAHSFYWPGLYADVAHFVRSCPTCAASKGSNHQRLGNSTILGYTTIH